MKKFLPGSLGGLIAVKLMVLGLVKTSDAGNLKSRRGQFIYVFVTGWLEQRTLVQALLADGQTHLFDNWHLGENEESKLMFLNQVFLLLEHGTWVIQSKVAVLRWNNGKI
jgi:hypothetical protein